MAATFVILACCLLAFSRAFTTTSGPTGSQPSQSDVQGSQTTIPSSSTRHLTPDTNVTHEPTGSTAESMTSTQASAASTSSLQTSPSVTPTTSTATSGPSPTTTTATAEVTTPAELPTTATPTPGGDTTLNPVSSSHTVSAAWPTTDGATEASRLSGLEKDITIVFSVALAVVLAVLSVCALRKCHSRRQFAHQPLDQRGDMRTFVSDDDTLFISGGLYDAHPIYDNVPTPSDEQHEYRLEFYR